MARLPDQSSPSLYWLEWIFGPANEDRPSISGRFGIPLTPVAITIWRGDIVRLVPSAVLSSTSHRCCLSSKLALVTSMPHQKFNSMAAAYDSNQSANMSFGIYVGHVGGNGMYGRWFTCS